MKFDGHGGIFARNTRAKPASEEIAEASIGPRLGRDATVFPVRTGKRAGAFHVPSGGFTQQLRRDQFRVAVCRLRPVEAPATTPGTRTDLSKRVDGTRLAPNPCDPLYYETGTTLPGLSFVQPRVQHGAPEAGVNVQHAMHLASHSDSKVHAR